MVIGYSNKENNSDIPVLGPGLLFRYKTGFPIYKNPQNLP